MPRTRLAILLSGMIAGDPWQGGAAWAVLQYLLGLRRLGHGVFFVEPVGDAALRPAGTSFAASDQARCFRAAARRFGFEDAAALLRAGTRETAGVGYEAALAFAGRADLLLNLSGRLRDEALFAAARTRVYLDLDPGFTQLWDAQGVDVGLAGHTRFATIGLDVGTSGCRVPDAGRRWATTLQPVVLDAWPAADRIVHDGFTTVGHWRSYGSIDHAGVRYGQRCHAFRRFMDLPARTPERLMPALAIHPGETGDLEALRANGWELRDPATVAASPDDYQAFVAGSKAELAIVKSGYAAADCGWFSDRSACYLASGRPVVAMETGFSRHLPVGEGLLAFRTTDEAAAGIEAIRAAYARHARAARELAAAHFDSDRVLPRFLEMVGGTG